MRRRGGYAHGAGGAVGYTARFSACLSAGWALVLTVAAASGLDPASASAHAVLLQSEPAATERLSETPAAIRLFFNERVETVPNSIRVVSLQRQQMEVGPVRLIDQGQGIEVSLPPLADGTYAVFWRVHAIDGHRVRGQFGFGINADPPDETIISGLAGAPGGLLPAWYFPALKWVSLLTASLWLGGLSFVWSVLAPAASAAPGSSSVNPCGTIPPFFRTLLTTTAVVFCLAEGLTLVGHSTIIADAGLLQAARPAALGVVLVGTNYGYWWIIKVFSAVALLLLTVLALPLRGAMPAVVSLWPASLGRSLALILGAVILLSIPMTGHARAVPESTWLAVASDWLHLAATAVWIGGLICFSLLLAHLRRADPTPDMLLIAVARRFSAQAVICVALLGASGVYNAWLHLPTWAALLASDYGRLLLLKGALIIPLLAVAALNRFRMLPALSGRTLAGVSGRTLQRLHKLVRTEAVLGVAILGIVGMLTNLPPASTAVATGPQQKRVGDFTVTLQMTPQQVGPNRLVVRLYDAGGAVVRDARRVTFFVNMLDMDMGLQTIPAQPGSKGVYTAEATLSMAGRWRIQVEVSPPRGDTFLTQFDFLAVAP